MQTLTFTSTISSDILKWLNQAAQTSKTTKRAILEKALLEYKENLKKQELKKTFQMAAKDQEVQELAEDGLEDYSQQLKALNL